MIRVTVFGVGQGLCSMVEIFDTSMELKFLALMDLGWGFKSDRLIQIVQQKMYNRKDYINRSKSTENIELRHVINASTTTMDPIYYYLDLLIYSHLDEDHINATKSLFGGISDECRIGKIFYGGSNRVKTIVVKESFEILKTMLILDEFNYKDLLYLDSKNSEIKVNPGSYSLGRKLNILPTDISFHNVISGFHSRIKGISGKKGCSDENKGSAIICIKYSLDNGSGGGENAHICFPGDPNVETLYQINKIIYPHPSKCEVMIAPHHGSGTTNKGYWIKKHSKKLNPPQFDILDKFIKISKPEIVQISAGYDFKYNHPDANVVNSMKRYCTNTGTHGVVCHSDDSSFSQPEYDDWVIEKSSYKVGAKKYRWHNIKTYKSIWNTNSVKYISSGCSKTFYEKRVFICDNI
jgi:beta-lactamase superfamily II metal-dependent hydrolase